MAPTGALEEGILCVRVSMIFLKITVKLSSSSILKSLGVKQASNPANKQASKQVSKQAGKQAGKEAGKH